MAYGEEIERQAYTRAAPEEDIHSGHRHCQGCPLSLPKSPWESCLEETLLIREVSLGPRVKAPVVLGKDVTGPAVAL